MVAYAPAHPVRDHCLAPVRPIDAPIAPVEGRYGRLFGDLEPLGGDDEVLLALGAPGGMCDATGRDEPEGDEAAGWPFFGQFLAHDITADRSPIGPRADPESIANFRAPRINLECVYGAGPVGAPFLYDRDDPAKLLVGDDDVPRNAQGIALLGDPRNDVHRFISQLHVAMLRAHNHLVDRLREDGVDDAACFDAARRALMWHVQWVVAEEFLPGLVGRDLVDELLDAGRRCSRPRGTPFIPFEFADAAFRYGHGQIRDAYRLNDRAAGLAVFPDLIGFGPVPPDHVIDWRRGSSAADAQRAKRMDGRLAPSLIRLPVSHHGRGRRRRLPLAGDARPAARRGDRAAVRGGGRARDARRAARPGRDRPRRPWLDGRDAALALRAARGDRARRWDTPRARRRPHRRGGPPRAPRRRPRVLPRPRSRVEPDAAERRRALRAARPAHHGR